MASAEEQIKKMYQSQIDAQKEQLKQDYLQADADLAAQNDKAQKATDANLNRTMVEAQKDAVSNAELRNASGLSSGAAAQARLSESNQLQSNLTALRVQQQEVDAEAERQRSLLAQEYSSAIRQAQAENDLAKAQALYEEAQRRNDEILSTQKEAANLMADFGNYDRLAAIYGLTPQEAAMLSSVYATQAVEEVPEITSMDEESVAALGYGNITEDMLNSLITDGYVEEYVENGVLKFRRTDKMNPLLSPLMPSSQQTKQNTGSLLVTPTTLLRK